jgi:sugar (pentulose or hexulose) kinase
MNDTDPVLVGIDAGLTNITVTAFNADGTELASVSRETPTVETVPDRDEQDHEKLWDVVCETTAAVVEHEDVSTDDIAGVGVAGHGHGLYGLDTDGEPVCGIKSTDSRAIDVLSDSYPEVYEAVVDRLGWEPFGADPLSLLVWLRDNDPETYERLETVLFSKDVLTYRLTGERSTDPSEGSVFYGPDSEYDEQVFTTLGIGDAFETLPSVVPSTNRCGHVTLTAANRTGLPEGTPVAAGLHDVAACTLGAGIVVPGDGLIILGTWGQSVAVLDDPDDGESGLPRRYLNGWLRYKGIRSGAACAKWFVENFGAEWRQEANERGVSPYVVYEEAVDSVPPGSDGLLFHPFLKGSTDNPNSAGGFYGLRLTHTNAHMLRSVYEGVTVTQVNALDSITTSIDAVRLTGGGSQSEAWTQMFADMSGLPVRVPSERETGALGAALCGGVAAGVYPTAEAAVDRTVGTASQYDPNPETESRYQTLTDAFEQTTDAMERPWETLKLLAESS